MSNKVFESTIQQQIYVWFENNYCLNVGKNARNPPCEIFAIPNGGSRNPIEAKNMKLQGVKSGVADLEVLLPGGVSIFFEVKTETGKQSDSQINWQKKITALGFDYYLVRNLEQFKECIEISLRKHGICNQNINMDKDMGV